MDILRYYRHDVLNDLQVVQAYSSMGKLEKVEEKIATYMVHFDEERKLMNLNAANLALWLIPFNCIHPNFRFTYAICVEKVDMSDIDEQLTLECKACVEYLQESTDDNTLYEGELFLEYLPETEQIQVTFILNGPLVDQETGSNKDDIIRKVTIPWNGKGGK